MRYLQKIILSLLFLCVLGVSAFAAPQYVYNTRAKIWDVISDTAVSVNGTNITNINHANIAASTFPAGCPFGEAMVQIAPGVSTCTKVIMYNSTSNNYQAQHHLDMSGFSIMFSSGGTLGNASSFYVFPASSFTGDVDFGGNTAKNVIIREASISNSNGSFTNLTATRVTITNGSNIQGISGTNIASGTVADARIASTIARDKEVTDISDQGLVLSINFNNDSIRKTSKGNVWAMDSSGKNNHLFNSTRMSTPVYQSNTGVSRSGTLFFNQYSDNFYSYTNLSNINFGDGATISFWVNLTYVSPNSGDYNISLPLHISYSRSTKYYTASNKNVYFFCSTNACQWGLRNGSSYTVLNPGAYGGNTSKWTHIVLRMNSTKYAFFINGGKPVVASPMQNMGWKPVALSIGGDTYNGNTYGIQNGSMDNLQIWDRDLSDDEISQLYTRKIEPSQAFVSQSNKIWIDTFGRLHFTVACIHNATTFSSTDCSTNITG